MAKRRKKNTIPVPVSHLQSRTWFFKDQILVNDHIGWPLKRTKDFGNIVDVGHWILQQVALKVLAQGANFIVSC